MSDDELVQKLKERGYALGTLAMGEDGVMRWLVNDLFMFRRDAVDLAEGVASLEDVIARNCGNVFPEAPAI